MTLEMLAEMGITEAESVEVYIGLLKRSIARLESLLAMAVDVVATPDQVRAKLGMLTLWRNTADAIAAAVDLLERGPMPVDDLRDEIMKSLLVGYAEVWSRDYCRERANNIAQAYAGRVAREPVTK